MKPASDSSRLLKANALRGLGSKVAFNFEDLKQRCDNYVEQVRQQAQQILIDAQQEANLLREKAHEEGRAAGQRKGTSEAAKSLHEKVAALTEEQVGEQLRTTLPALTTAIAAIDAERNRWLAAWETAAIQLSVAIAEKLLHRELSREPELAKAAILEALELAAGSPQITLRLNPFDVQVLGTWSEEIVQAMLPAGQATIQPDDSVTAGGCLIETKHGIIDGRREQKLARIAEELLEGAFEENAL